MQNSSQFGRYAACVQRVNVRFAEPSYPQEECITEGIYTARNIPFTANERRKSIPGFLGAILCHHFFDAIFRPGVPLN